MNFETNEIQRQLVEHGTKLLERIVPRTLVYHHDLDGALEKAGLYDLGQSTDAGPLEGVMLAERIAEKGGMVAFTASVLVAPRITDLPLARPVALAMGREEGPIRFGAEARTLLIADDADVRVRLLREGEALPIKTNFAYPVARVPRDGGERIVGAAATMRAWWRIALAAELVGCMEACLDLTRRHLQQREQFGRPIGTFQALQHRLAQCAVLCEGARWLTYEAAWLGAPAEAACVAAAQACAAAQRVFHESHQMHGAIGFTREHDLHRWSMRLPALALELGGANGHYRGITAERWKA